MSIIILVDTHTSFITIGKKAGILCLGYVEDCQASGLGNHNCCFYNDRVPVDNMKSVADLIKVVYVPLGLQQYGA